MEATGKMRQIEITENSLFYKNQNTIVYQSTHIYILLAAFILPKVFRG
jgi:hypothetical protein